MADSLVLYNDDEGNLRGFWYKDQMDTPPK